MAAAALLIPAAGEVHLTVAVGELPTAEAAALTAIVRINAVHKGPPLFNEAGLLLSQYRYPSQFKTRLRNSLFGRGLDEWFQTGHF
jgi:hypothetical protein